MHILEFDATDWVKAFNMGVEFGFMLAAETPELDKHLDENKIDLPDDE